MAAAAARNDNQSIEDDDDDEARLVTRTGMLDDCAGDEALTRTTNELQLHRRAKRSVYIGII